MNQIVDKCAFILVFEVKDTKNIILDNYFLSVWSLYQVYMADMCQVWFAKGTFSISNEDILLNGDIHLSFK